MNLKSNSDVLSNIIWAQLLKINHAVVITESKSRSLDGKEELACLSKRIDNSRERESLTLIKTPDISNLWQ